MSKKSSNSGECTTRFISFIVYISTICYPGIILAAKKGTSFNDIGVPIVSVIGLIFVIGTAYITQLLKNISFERQSGDDKISTKVEQIKEILDHHRAILDDHYNRLKDVEKITEITKIQFDNLLEQHKKHHD